ncbi:MAG: hypothetical protein A4E19_01170 [Nitrospira sp. SG-bin1]|nr:MAG: hypothetical protein A4E19_01170 [Nitrospira sp. SG-bin1]
MPSITKPEAPDTYGHDAHKQSRYVERRHIETSCPQFTFVDERELDEWLSCTSSHLLALISFGGFPPALPRSITCPRLFIDLTPLTTPPLVEVWTSTQPVTVVQRDHFCAGMNGNVAAAFLSVEESPGISLETTTYRAYLRLLSELRSLGYPNVWRLWNYFPGINDHRDGLERYQRFCMGRHDALLETLQDFPASLPAGTAIGTASGPLLIYALAGTHRARHLGNPRQIHAYEYPKSYGPRSPSFSRATIASVDGSTQLFVAGTASVVGHASQHTGSTEAQTRETIENIRTLLRHATDAIDAGSFIDHHRANYKVYVRHKSDVEPIRHIIEEALLPKTQPLFLQGDLCRGELLVEIEAVVTPGSKPAC